MTFKPELELVGSLFLLADKDVANTDAPDNVIHTLKVAVIKNTENHHHHHHLKKQGTRPKPMRLW